MHLLARLGYARAPHVIFNRANDDEWFALNTTAYRRYPVLRRILPTMPNEKIQQEFIGSTGDVALREGYNFYLLIKDLTVKYDKSIGFDTKILDFGCGWGRMLRFFMREVCPENLHGVDSMPLAIELCRQTNSLCQFQLVNAAPPMHFADSSFDLIYLYSVFSHLSEERHDRWLDEFYRVLRPGGLLVATTWHREYIEWCERARQGDRRHVHSLSSKAFMNPRAWLAKYDAGEFCHSPVGASLDLSDSFYGETCIPEAYVEKYWTERFKLRDYLYADLDRRGQNVIVVQK